LYVYEYILTTPSPEVGAAPLGSVRSKFWFVSGTAIDYASELYNMSPINEIYDFLQRSAATD
jgi:hypothetical protein